MSSNDNSWWMGYYLAMIACPESQNVSWDQQRSKKSVSLLQGGFEMQYSGHIYKRLGNEAKQLGASSRKQKFWRSLTSTNETGTHSVGYRWLHCDCTAGDDIWRNKPAILKRVGGYAWTYWEESWASLQCCNPQCTVQNPHCGVRYYGTCRSQPELSVLGKTTITNCPITSIQSFISSLIMIKKFALSVKCVHPSLYT